MTTITTESLFSCRIAPLRGGNYVMIRRQHTRYNPAVYSIHPLMADGRSIGSQGQRITSGESRDYITLWDDTTNYCVV